MAGTATPSASSLSAEKLLRVESYTKFHEQLSDAKKELATVDNETRMTFAESVLDILQHAPEKHQGNEIGARALTTLRSILPIVDQDERKQAIMDKTKKFCERGIYMKQLPHLCEFSKASLEHKYFG